MSVTYADLVRDIQFWQTNNDEQFVSQIPAIIDLAELRILRDVDLRYFRRTQERAVSSVSPFLTLPDDILVARHLYLKAGGSVLLQTLSFIHEYWPVQATTGTPRYYAHFDEKTLVIAPTPAAGTEFRLTYTYRPLSIVTQETTWLSRNAGDLLLAAANLEAAVTLEVMPERMAVFQNAYEEAKARVQALESRNALDENIARVSP